MLHPSLVFCGFCLSCCLNGLVACSNLLDDKVIHCVGQLPLPRDLWREQGLAGPSKCLKRLRNTRKLRKTGASTAPQLWRFVLRDRATSNLRHDVSRAKTHPARARLCLGTRRPRLLLLERADQNLDARNEDEGTGAVVRGRSQALDSEAKGCEKSSLQRIFQR